MHGPAGAGTPQAHLGEAGPGPRRRPFDRNYLGPVDLEMQPHRGGRSYSESRPVRLSDVGPDGRLRLDALAGYLQDVAAADVRDAGVEEAVAWVVRRTTISVGRLPAYGREVELQTWCSGIGASLAERRTTVRYDGSVMVDAVALWVSLDRETGRPVPLTGTHFDPYRDSAGERRVKSRFRLPPAPDPAGRHERPWNLRHSDFDVLGHVNNSVSWAALEDEARRRSPEARIRWGEVEYRQPLGPGDDPVLASRPEEGGLSIWLLTSPDDTATSGRLGLASP